MQRLYRMELGSDARHVVERDGRWHVVEGDIFGAWAPGAELTGRGRLLAPVVPSKIVAVGLNYRDHAAERGKALPLEPMIFLKPSTAVIGPGDAIRLPVGVGRVDHEAELGVVMRTRASRVSRAAALDCVLGFTCINDVTARDLQDRGAQYSHVKGFDSFAPLGPAVAVGLDPTDLRVEGAVNGTIRQASTTAQLIFPVDVLIEYISAIMTLLPGDVIATGTPAGIGPLRPGDQVAVRIEGIGELTNPVEG